jgi:hypothetical protein
MNGTCHLHFGHVFCRFVRSGSSTFRSWHSMVDASVSGFSRWRLTRLWNRVGEGGGGFSSEMPVLGASGGFATMAEGPAPGAVST